MCMGSGPSIIIGFGFVDFHESEDATKAVSQKFIDIKQKQVEIKKAEPRSAKGKNAPQGGTDFTPYPNQGENCRNTNSHFVLSEFYKWMSFVAINRSLMFVCLSDARCNDDFEKILSLVLTLICCLHVKFFIIALDSLQKRVLYF